MRPRPPDWLIYGVLVALVLAAALSRRQRAMAPEAPPPVPGAARMPLATTSPFAASPVEPASAGAVRSGRTAFSISETGVWVTAGQGFAACRKLGVMIADGRAVPARRASGSGAVLVLTTAGAGAPGLPLAAGRDVHPGELGFMPGFPEGKPGEVGSRLIGPVAPIRGARPPVLAWAEIGHTEGLTGARRGLVGAPVLDNQGRVAGVTLGASPRRGRVYATRPDVLRQALASAKVTQDPAGPGQPIGTDTYGRVADALRRDLRVVEVVCLKG
jgi:serine protease Do